MFDVIDDVMAEQNTNQENIDEEGRGIDPKFDDLFKELNTKLYPECSNMSTLNFLARLLHIKVINRWTNSSFGGPVHMRWMYPFERYMKKLKNYVRNKAKPEGSIAEGYVADEALTFCYMYLEGMQTKFNRVDRNEDPGLPKRQFNVFSSQYRPMSTKKLAELCKDAKKSLHWFVLNNCDEDELKGYIS
ncbi:unnamed protein product [Lactuca saligna]|uniref:DUF4218 domain-containing protein n=1 Tax=Lactuca saligna TaxID=75948 RepID=A0AA35V2F5_LACSI|nr:unnamed protein product [Lactuca saligna]